MYVFQHIFKFFLLYIIYYLYTFNNCNNIKARYILNRILRARNQSNKNT